MPKISDRSLAEKTQQGDKEAFGKLVERYEKKILRYGRKFLNNPRDIEDIVQDIFLKAYSNIQSFDSKRKFSPWLYRIAHNEFINFIKKKEKQKIQFFDPDVLLPQIASDQETDERVKKEERNKLLTSSLNQLDLKYRETLILYYQEDLSYEEISDVMRIPTSTVGVRLKRGREKLKENWQEKNKGK